MQAGDQVGSYEIVGLLGEGGFAQVYRVRHRVLGSDHALKVLRTELLDMEEVRSRFLDEARVQAQLKHPNIVQVTDLIAEPGVAGFVMEFIEGPSLGHEIEQRVAGDDRPTPAEVRAVFLPVLDAVASAHAAGVVHRDLKPENILLARSHTGALVPKVTDFGIAKVGGALKGKRKTTLGARTLGTVGYMSPEQLVSSRDVDARADIFSLGVALLEYATLVSPFERDSEFLTMKAVHEADYTVPDWLRAQDAALVAAVERALRVERDERHADCAAMAAALTAPPKRSPRPGRQAGSPAPSPPPAPAPPPAHAPPPAPDGAERHRPKSRAMRIESVKAAEPRLGPGWPSVPRGPVAPGALRVRVEGFVPYRGVDLTARTTIGSHTRDTLTVHGPGVERGHFVLEPTRHGWRVVAARGPVQVGDHDVVRGGSWIPDLTRETRLVAGSIVFRLQAPAAQASSGSAHAASSGSAHAESSGAWEPPSGVSPACPRMTCRSTNTKALSPYRGVCERCGETFPHRYAGVPRGTGERRMDDRAAVPDASNADDSGGCFGCFMVVAAFCTLAAMAGGC